jgi:hypothetical protein
MDYICEYILHPPHVEYNMRISDDRYNRDRLRFDLALRMMQHGARTSTIRTWTGLSDDRIRKLFRSYLAHGSSGAPRRHRGKSPQLAANFLQSATIGFEATTLSCLFSILGLIPKDTGGPLSLEQGETFCQAYEAYAVLHIRHRLSFEHAWFLLLTLLKDEELKLCGCKECGRLYLTDVARERAFSCGCNLHRLGWPRRRRMAKARSPDRLTQDMFVQPTDRPRPGKSAPAMDNTVATEADMNGSIALRTPQSSLSGGYAHGNNIVDVRLLDQSYASPSIETCIEGVAESLPRARLETTQ